MILHLGAIVRAVYMCVVCRSSEISRADAPGVTSFASDIATPLSLHKGTLSSVTARQLRRSSQKNGVPRSIALSPPMSASSSAAAPLARSPRPPQSRKRVPAPAAPPSSSGSAPQPSKQAQHAPAVSTAHLFKKVLNKTFFVVCGWVGVETVRA